MSKVDTSSQQKTAPVAAGATTASEPKTSQSTKKPTPTEKLAVLQRENQLLREKAARAMADYQNLERRQREEKSKTLEYARETVFSSLLQPLEHLTLAANTLHDQGLDMVVAQFWQTLGEQGLVKLEPIGQAFDVATMEALEKVGDGETVQAVLSPGFTLNGRLLRPAKVKVG